MKLWRLIFPALHVPVDPPVAVLFPEPLRSEVVRLREQGRDVEAVRVVRQQTGLPLLAAVNAVRAARQDDV